MTAAVREEVLQLRLKGLRLPAFLAHYASLAKKTTAEGLGPIEYLAELAEVEVAELADRRRDAAEALPGSPEILEWEVLVRGNAGQEPSCRGFQDEVVQFG